MLASWCCGTAMLCEFRSTHMFLLMYFSRVVESCSVIKFLNRFSSANVSGRHSSIGLIGTDSPISEVLGIRTTASIESSFTVRSPSLWLIMYERWDFASVGVISRFSDEKGVVKVHQVIMQWREVEVEHRVFKCSWEGALRLWTGRSKWYCNRTRMCVERVFIDSIRSFAWKYVLQRTKSKWAFVSIRYVLLALFTAHHWCRVVGCTCKFTRKPSPSFRL